MPKAIVKSKFRILASSICCIGSVVALGGCASETPSTPDTAPEMSFFITSSGPGNGANLGGLEGADAHCQSLASAVGAGSKTWRAYLSQQASDQSPSIDAKDRIGQGPWYNEDGVMVAKSVDDLLSDGNLLGKLTSLSERGDQINGRNDTPNRHDILTGTTLDGTAPEGAANLTCGNWTSSGTGSALVGHHDRQGGGDNPTSWSSAHPTRGCSQSDLQASGGDGLFYCFAID